MGQYQKGEGYQPEKFTINDEADYHVFGFDFTVKKVTLHVLIRDGPIVPANTRIRLVIVKGEKEQSAFGVYLGNNAISYSFDFAVGATEEFELSMRNRGGIAHAMRQYLLKWNKMRKRRKQSIFDFNHIDPSLREEELEESKSFPILSQKIMVPETSAWSIQENESAHKLASSGLVAIGTIAGGVTMNPIVLE